MLAAIHLVMFHLAVIRFESVGSVERFRESVPVAIEPVKQRS